MEPARQGIESNNSTSLHPLAFTLLRECYAPTKRFHNSHTAALGLLAFEMCGLQLEQAARLEHVLPSVTQHVIERGVGEHVILDWGSKYDQSTLGLIHQGILEGRAQAGAQAEAILGNTPAGIAQDKRLHHAVDRIARTAYEGKMRKSGKSYYSHPEAVAAISLETFTQLKAEGYLIKSDIVDAVISLGMLHDVEEDTQRTPAPYDPGRPEKRFSPLLLSELFRCVNNPYGPRAAHSLRRLTHLKQPWAPTYSAYIKRSIEEESTEEPLAALSKFADVCHNLYLDPKPRPSDNPERVWKIHRKETLYQKSIEYIQAHAPEVAGSPPWVRRYFEIMLTLKAADLPAYVDTLNNYRGLSAMDANDAA